MISPRVFVLSSCLCFIVSLPTDAQREHGKKQEPSPAAPPVKVFSPHNPSVTRELEPQGMLEAHDPDRVIPAAGGRALVSEDGNLDELLVFRIDQPKSLGRIGLGDSTSFTANLHSVYVFDYKTFAITRYPLNTLQAEKSYQVVTDNRVGYRMQMGANGNRNPLFVTDQYNVEFIDPFTLKKMRIGVRNHDAPSRYRTEVRLSHPAPSPDGEIVGAGGYLCWLQNNTFHAFATAASTEGGYPRLTFNGGHVCYSSHIRPLAPPFPEWKLHPEARSALVPALTAPLAWKLDLAENRDRPGILKLFSINGRIQILEFEVPERASFPFISVDHKRLALFTPKGLAVYALDITKVARELNVPPWLEIRGPGLAKMRQSVSLAVRPAFGTMKTMRLLRGPDGATFGNSGIHWKTPKVTEPTSFQFVVEYEDETGREGRAFTEVTVVPL